MTRRFNGKSLVDEIATRIWDTSTASKARIIGWLNEIQDDIASDLPSDFFKIKLKKLLPTSQDVISLNIQKPSAPTTALVAGGSLTDTSSYKVYVSFLVYDDSLENYIESELSEAGIERTATAIDKQINLSAIDTLDGASGSPSNVYRRIYMATKTSSGEYGEPFFVADIADNTTTTYSITAATTSTITPVSDSEIERITPDRPIIGGNKSLYKESMDKLISFNPSGSDSATPSYYDFVGTHSIYLYPKLSSSATTAQRTLTYFVYRRPHEVFYDVDRAIDLPIIAKKALIQGVVWLAYKFKDRSGSETEKNDYEMYKGQLLTKLNRQQGRPSAVRDVNGDTFGFEV